MSVAAVFVSIGLVILGYLIGSLSPSVYLGKTLRGIDLRDHGSGNAGTTNAFRVFGKRFGSAVLVADLLKGAIPVVISRSLEQHDLSHPVVTVLVAFACVLGHDFSLFLRGRGGKGVATGAGAAFAMLPLPMACLVLLFAVVLIVTRTVSIASITATVSLPVLAGLLYRYGSGLWAVPLPYVVACCLMAALVLWAHRGNVQRLARGEENRVTFPWNRKPAEDTRGAESSSDS